MRSQQATSRRRPQPIQPKMRRRRRRGRRQQCHRHGCHRRQRRTQQRRRQQRRRQLPAVPQPRLSRAAAWTRIRRQTRLSAQAVHRRGSQQCLRERTRRRRLSSRRQEQAGRPSGRGRRAQRRQHASRQVSSPPRSKAHLQGGRLQRQRMRCRPAGVLDQLTRPRVVTRPRVGETALQR